MKYMILAFMLFFAGLNLNAATTEWEFDKSHSAIKFSVKHMLIAETWGRFKDIDGKVMTNGDNFENAQIEFKAKIASIDTDNQKRDEHLRSDDFFNADKYPEMKFVSKSMKKSGKNKFKLVGDLTIRDVTRSVTLDVEFNGTAVAWGKTKAGFKIKGKINRFDFNLKWDKALETGGLIVGRDVNIICEVEIDKKG